MSKVFLITGFQNWGKTFLIHAMFNGRVKYFYNQQYKYSNFDFCVQSQSNDDLGKNSFERIIKKRLLELSKSGVKPSHICAAFCPTKESNNLSDKIIENIFPEDEVYIIAIEHKWCLHGQLQIQEIQNYYSHLKNVTVHVVSEKDPTKKKAALDAVLKPLL
ncbi:hypothetical protein DU972_003793 [Vibrio mimicus]